jgi:hypothetical protein
MAYVNYWRWKTSIADVDTFAEWSSDIQYLLDELSMPDRELPPYAYGGCWPNASHGGYTPVFYRTHISGPSGKGEACEPFIITLRDLKTANPFASCKTRAEPYDLLVICALVRLAHYFPDVLIASDGEEHTIPMAVRICREVFGDTRLPVVDHWQDEEEKLSG